MRKSASGDVAVGVRTVMSGTDAVDGQHRAVDTDQCVQTPVSLMTTGQLDRALDTGLITATVLLVCLQT